MKLLKNIDNRLKDIGFIKIEEDGHGALYERKNEEYSYIQRLDLMHKNNGSHVIQSYQKNVNSDGFNNMIGLTMYETKLAIKKMKRMGFKINKPVVVK